ncbi:hypothetical protein GOP47_0023318, partial [Adiantum capillus-veneris]
EAHSARGSASATLSRGKSWPFSPDALILRGAQRRGDGERCKVGHWLSRSEADLDDWHCPLFAHFCVHAQLLLHQNVAGPPHSPWPPPLRLYSPGEHSHPGLHRSLLWGCL